jgi:ubiquinone/menaquinone biosynthesis C-methylase UbiE
MTDVEDQRSQLVDRMFAAGLGMGELLTIHLGDALGLYRALQRTGPMTAAELAKDTGIFERYALEWLEQQAAAGILEVDDVSTKAAQRRYLLPAGHAEPLLDRESLYSMAPFANSFVALAGAMPNLLEAFRNGGGVNWGAYGTQMIEAQGDFNRPWLVSSLGSEYLPSIPDLHERLSSPEGARVADIACGVGWAAISLARAYPNITVDGFDLDEESIAMALQNAKDAGLEDRVRFAVRDAVDPALEGQYDMAIVVEAIHDLSHPVAVLGAIRTMLKPTGTLVVADEKTEDAFTAPAGEVERLMYSYSVLTCLPSAMDDPASAATGTVMRKSTFERYAKEAGFERGVSVLPFEHDFLRFYRLDR